MPKPGIAARKDLTSRTEDTVQEKRYFVIQTLIELDGGQTAFDRPDTIGAAVRSSLRAGLRADVKEMSVYRVTEESCLPGPKVGDKAGDNVVAQYSHKGMSVTIYSASGKGARTEYFAVVTNPNVKQKSGTLLRAEDPTSLGKTRKVAEARAKRKAELLAARKRKN